MHDTSAKKLFFLALGCDKNRVDAEHMLGRLAGKVLLTDTASEADIIIVHTCCFIQEATQESIDAVLEMADLRRKGVCSALLVTGCMPERYREEILQEIPEVDALLGPASGDRLEEALRKVTQGETCIFLDPPKEHLTQEPARILTTGGFFAYLKIAEGCNRHCTYCVIPSLRGPYRSIPMDDLRAEAEELAQRGVRELILVAQDTACYGVDLYGEKRLPHLLRELAQIPGIEWLRLLYVYPEEIDNELITVLREEKKVCPYLDMPIQHAEDRILQRMGRKTTRADLEGLISHLRTEIPEITLRTTLITGFPGETEEEHRAVLEFIRRQRFDRLGVFAYSPEEGTPAASFPHQIPETVKERRREELLTVQQEISAERGQAQIGKTLQVLVEGQYSADHTWIGRSTADAPEIDGQVFFTGNRLLHSGDFAWVRITQATEYDLMGEEDEILEEDESAQ